MKSKKKVLGLLVCAVLLVVGSVMGTMAWLTSTTEVATNTFSTGDVEITLDEAKVTEYGVEVDGADRVLANTYKLIPGHEYAKDPTIHVSAIADGDDFDSEDCYLFVKVVNPITGIEAGTTIAQQMANEGLWTPVTEGSNIYYYKNVVTAGTDVVVFENFTIADKADVADYEGTAITVQAYAVQADGFTDAADAWTKAPCTAW